MFNNLDSNFNAKYNFTYELSTRGVDGSPHATDRTECILATRSR
jgi:hypothetical protein